jgi:hypothetical protein
MRWFNAAAVMVLALLVLPSADAFCNGNLGGCPYPQGLFLRSGSTPECKPAATCADNCEQAQRTGGSCTAPDGGQRITLNCDGSATSVLLCSRIIKMPSYGGGRGGVRAARAGLKGWSLWLQRDLTV